MGKIEDAIKKINLQIQMSPNDKYRALIGEYIIDQITTEAAAEQILQAEKTLNRALVERKNTALKRGRETALSLRILWYTAGQENISA